MMLNNSSDDHEVEKGEELARLNVLISLCGYYFGQGENLMHIPLNESGDSVAVDEDEMECSDEDDEAIEIEIEEYVENEDVGLKRKRNEASSNANKISAVDDLEDGECEESMLS